MQHIEELLELLRLTDLGSDTFRGQHPQTKLQRTFGGQVMAQALAATYRTMARDRLCHSLQGYFLRPGATSSDLTYVVHRIRDGGSFSTRRVQAYQDGHEIFEMTASFKRPEEGLEHARPPSKPPAPPEQCPPLSAVLGMRSPRTAEVWEREWAALDTRFVGSSNRVNADGARMQMWLKAKGELPDDPRVHQMILAYASDLTLLSISTLPHPEAFGSPRLQMVTIDHAMWFHRPIRADEWVLYDQHSPSAGNALGIAFGRLYSADMVLGGQAVQQGLIRMADDRKRKGLV